MKKNNTTTTAVVRTDLNRIYTSRASSKFNLLPFNRQLTRHHIDQITKSITRHGWLGTATCVRTNLFSKGYKLYIIDGQHRIQSATDLGIRFRYEIRNVKTLEEIVTLMADLNNNSKGWFLHDYLSPWRTLGISSYKVISDVWQKTKLPLASLIVLYSASTFGSDIGGTSTEKFKRGGFVLKNKELAEKIITEVMAIKPILNRNLHPFMMAFADFYITNGKAYKRDKFIAALKKHKKEVQIITKTVDMKAILKKIYK